MLPVKIAGLGWYLPEQRITNEQLEKQLGFPSHWIERATGVQERSGQLHIYLTIVPTASFAEVAQSVRESIAATLAQYNCRPATVQIEEGLPPAVPGAKRRRVRRMGEE